MSWACTSVPITRPRFVRAPAAVVAFVPPLLTARVPERSLRFIAIGFTSAVPNPSIAIESPARKNPCLLAEALGNFMSLDFRRDIKLGDYDLIQDSHEPARDRHKEYPEDLLDPLNLYFHARTILFHVREMIILDLLKRFANHRK